MQFFSRLHKTQDLRDYCFNFTPEFPEYILSSMLHKTKGIILRTIKYGETSVICSIFTELLGLQSYMIKGVRTGKSRTNKANLLFSSSMLDMVVYHQPQKNLQLVKESQAAYLYHTVQENVIKNGVAVFAMEIVTQLLADHDPAPELFYFTEDFLKKLDAWKTQAIANFPLYFVIRAGKLAGYHLSGSYSAGTPHADLHEGRYSSAVSRYPPFIEGREAEIMSMLNYAADLESISQVKMTNDERRQLLHHFIAFLQLHVAHFRDLKSLPVLTSILY